jgi:long-chain acyl-CoA synthetase
MNLAEYLERSAHCFPDRPAIFQEERKISYWDFNKNSNRVATALIGLGIQRGDFVGLCAPNSIEWLVSYFGILKAGATAVTLPITFTKSELRRLLDDALPKVLFTIDEKLEDLGDRKDRPYLNKVVSPAGDISYDRLIEKGSDSFKAVDMDRDDTAAILYTGGTTGVPKGVMLTHENIRFSAHNVCHFERSGQEDRALCFLPPNHVFAQIHIMNSMVYAAGSLVVQPSFDMDRAVEALNRFNITKFYAVPTIYFRFLQMGDPRKKLGPVNYCFSAAASMPAELVRAWKSNTGLNIHESYGMTETASMVTYNHFNRHVVGSIGTPVNIVEVQIRDLEGNILGPREEGEICIRGPNVMKGYLHNPEETKAAFWGGWLRSGDIGAFDEDGYLYIIDRIKDMIITGGETVYPREIEEVLYKRPEVGECSVIGLPDDEYGERVTACIVLRQQDQSLDAGEVKSFLKGHLAPFKVPKQFIILDALPKSVTGKILKRKLKDQIVQARLS